MAAEGIVIIRMCIYLSAHRKQQKRKWDFYLSHTSASNRTVLKNKGLTFRRQHR